MFFRKFVAPSIIAALVVLVSARTSATAGTVIADFNDNTAGQFSHVDPGVGQAGGTGFDPDANNTWGNTGTISVIADDLEAPASTNYGVTQNAGTAQSVQGNWAAGRQATRVVEEVLTGTVWFSYLLNQPTAESRGGITFNQNGSSPGNPRIVAVGTEVRLALTTIQPPGGGALGAHTLGETALVLGRLVINPGGDEVLDVWVNPDVSGGEAGLPAPTNSMTEQSDSLDAGISRVGVQTYSSDTQGGVIDSLRVSDAANAFDVVTSGAAVMVDDPNLTVMTNPFASLIFAPEQPAVTVDITIENTGTANTLTISDTSAITGTGAASYTLLTVLPIDILPGGNAVVQVEFDPAGAAGDYEAVLDLDSNDQSSATIGVSLNASVPTALQIPTGNPFAGLFFDPDPAPTNAEIFVENLSSSNAYTIEDTSAITGDAAANFSILSPLPVTILAGGNATLVVQFDAAGGDGNFNAGLQLATTETGNSAIDIPLQTTVPVGGANVLVNGDFEADTVALPDWIISGAGAGASAAQGFAPGSATAAAVAAGGFMNQPVVGAGAWFADFYFQAPDTQARAFNVLVTAPGGQFNIRYQGDIQQWNAFDNVNNGDSWGGPLGLGAITSGATYFMRIVGTGWNGSSPTYDLFLSEADSVALTRMVQGLNRYQNGVPGGPPTTIRFSAEFGGGPGFTVDDVRFVNGPPPPANPLRILSIDHDRILGETTITWAAQPGNDYFIYASDDLADFEEIADAVPNSTTGSITDFDASGPHRFYLISEDPLE